MDPFSVAVGTGGLLDICSRFLTFVISVKKRSVRVDEVLESLSAEVTTVKNSTEIIKNLHGANLDDRIKNGSAERRIFDNAWQCIGDLAPKCERTITSLLQLLQDVQDVHLLRGTKFHGILKEIKRRSRDSEFEALRRELTNYCSTIQLLLTSIQTLSSYDSRLSQDDMREQLSSLDRRISKFIPLLESQSGSRLRGAFHAATAVKSLGSRNEHFDIPQSVSSIFTGRENCLKELASTMFNTPVEDVSPARRNAQKRFVIYGLGGSGKTQFCCKFAQDNRQRFWGVFWVDCSTEERAQQTFARIATYAGRQPNERAAKSWLSSLKKPWLLIIDNVDDANFPLENYFPGGEKGHILITTRNPPHRTHGTIGKGYFDFSRWNSDAAPTLLLKASNVPKPWSQSVQDMAAKISKALGELPLALIVAGKTIMKGVCSLANYLQYYERHWKRMRNRATRGQSSEPQAHTENSSHYQIIVTCEMMYRSLQNDKSQAASDAIDLLNVFSFLDRVNVSVSLLRQTVTNPRLEQQQDQDEREQEYTSGPGRHMFGWIRGAGSLINGVLRPEHPRPILPEVLRLSKDSDEEDFDEDRLKEALVELSQRSLIMYHTEQDTYSMHPILHKWVRERPEMKTANQAIWCKAAETLLSQAILLPPLGRTLADDDFRRSLLPHVLSVRAHTEEIERHFSKHQAERRSLPLAVRSSMDKKDAVAMAKYGLVFSQCGMFKEALDLQRAASTSAAEQLGPRDVSTIKVQLALACTYWQLGHGNQAAALQEGCLKAMSESLHENHPQRLRTMDSLGESRWLQGRYEEAQDLHSQAIKGLTDALGPDHEDTFRAKDHLGRIALKYYRYEHARQLHAEALEGLTAALGAEHFDTIIARDNLAAACLELGDEENLDRARSLAESVMEARTRKLGREHPYTLWAALNLARIKGAQGSHADAEADLLRGLKVALKSLGEMHVGVLWARMHLGWIRHMAGRHAEAVEELRKVIEGQAKLPTAVRGMHPDRLQATLMLADCLGRAGKEDEGMEVCRNAVKGHRDIVVDGGWELPVVGKLEALMDDLRKWKEERREREGWGEKQEQGEKQEESGTVEGELGQKGLPAGGLIGSAEEEKTLGEGGPMEKARVGGVAKA